MFLCLNFFKTSFSIDFSSKGNMQDISEDGSSVFMCS